MVGTFDSSCSAGGTLHLPSPTHVHHHDPTSAIRSLRRSLSRSPSKGPAFRLITSQSPSPSPHSSLSPSPLSPSSRAASPTLTAPVKSPSPLGMPYPPSARVNRASARRQSSVRPSGRCRISPDRSKRRPLSLAMDNGNARPPSPTSSWSSGGEMEAGSASPSETLKRERESEGPTAFADGKPSAPASVFSRMDRGAHIFTKASSAASSPRKRSDDNLNQDQASLGSPVPKRRSLFSPGLGAELNELLSAASGSLNRRADDGARNADERRPRSIISTNTSPFFAPMPKRSSSLRKSTLQQRYSERPIFAQSKPNMDLAFEFTNHSSLQKRGHHRMSLENFLPPMARDSPFTSAGPLPNASIHTVPPSIAPHNGSRAGHTQPHPLSQAISQSSSASSLAEGSSTQVASAPMDDDAKPSIDFSKSLPIDPRPVARRNLSEERLESAARTGSYVTPQNYRLVKPLPEAFMSTGLISKRNRNPEAAQHGIKGGKSNMPDTPCKKPTMVFQLAPFPAPERQVSSVRKVRHNFGAPSTPLNQHYSAIAPGSVGTGFGIFGSKFAHDVHRSGSSEEDISHSPSGRGDSQGSDYDLPPTPTKPAHGMERTSPVSAAISINRKGMDMMGRHSIGQGRSGKLSLSQDVTDDMVLDGENPVEEPPCAGSKFAASQATSTFSFSSTTSRLKAHGLWPSPLSKRLLGPRPRCASPSPMSAAKTKRLSTASPTDFLELPHRMSPHTPQDTMLPPDPSGLSISGHGHEDDALVRDGANPSASPYPPATPTTIRDGSFQYPHAGSNITPKNGFASNDVDLGLLARFQKVELVGTGQFSTVYKVSRPLERSASPSPAHGLFSGGRTPARSVPEQVFAVKKSKHPYTGPKERQRMRHEVDVLRALSRADHVVHLVDEWEERNHLYIQTEFCDEGSLAEFLTQVGKKARLDDFRIWKMMLELCLGVKNIHDCGFIHLDLKPANVLITFAGVLKIGDFGMATEWPARPGIEGEGDREYIGPEILMGQFDKPADIFALGLIVLEMAGNVELPDNGPSWQKLRSGDMSDVPSLTWSSGSYMYRDASGEPVPHQHLSEDQCDSDNEDEEEFAPSSYRRRINEGRKLFKNYKPRLCRIGELRQPPQFMLDAEHQDSLDQVVRWMISPNPQHRPTIDQVLCTFGVRWAETRRRAGAVVYEGNWGPADNMVGADAEMKDV